MEINNPSTLYYSNGVAQYTHRNPNSIPPITKTLAHRDNNDILQLSLPGPPKESTGFTYGAQVTQEYIHERKLSIEYNEEDLRDIKQRFSDMTGRQKEITGKLQSLLEKMGGKLGMGDTIKIEISHDGKAVVGGIRDGKLAKKLENTINKNKEFIKEIKSFQEEEKSVSRDLKNVTGQSLSDFESRITDLQKCKQMDTLSGDTREGWVYSKDECINLEDQDLYMVDQDFATMISDYDNKPQNTIGTHSVDFSGANNILLDADKTVDGIFGDIMDKVYVYLEGVNEHIREKYKDEPEEIEKHKVGLQNVTISLTSDGNVAIDGDFSKSGLYDDVVKEVISQKIFKEELKINPYTGEQHDYYIAAQYLENQYDIGVGDTNKKRMLETTFKDGKFETHLSSPEEEQKLADEIGTETRDALKEAGVQNAESLDIAITDDGKIVVENMPENRTQHQTILRALEILNSSIENRSSDDIGNYSKFGSNRTERLKSLMAKMDIFLPGGAKKIMDMKPSEALEKELSATVSTNEK